MNCDYCKNPAPENVEFLRESYVCAICKEKPFDHFRPLKVELEDLYHVCKQVPGMRILYISDLTNNLAKIKQHFLESVDLSNPPCTVVLVLPQGIDQLMGSFDGVYIDSDIPDKELMVSALDIPENGYVKWVEPTRQAILVDYLKNS